MSEPSKDVKRTQAERRKETRTALLQAACQLFGQRGFESTSLEEIADECGLTIRPIYYHFGSKLGLFSAVNALMEQRARKALSADTPVHAWEALLELCEDQAFRKIVLEDAPNVLGRERWPRSQSFPWASALGKDHPGPEAAGSSQAEMRGRIARIALTEAAMAVMESANKRGARKEAIELIARLFAEPSAAEQKSYPQQTILNS